jgi:hypothetical protein
MTQFRPICLGRLVLSLLTGCAFLGTSIQPSPASGRAASTTDNSTPKALVSKSDGAKADCITPDGRLVAVPDAGEKNAGASAMTMDAVTLRCSLQEGDTTFIISFPKASFVDHFTFVNENVGVQGDMRIAVSDCRLPANSPKWNEVSGKTEFASKRLFNLSMIGVGARYVKLAFHVEKGDQVASTSRFDTIVP